MSELEALGFREFTDDEVQRLEDEYLGGQAADADPLDALGWEEM